MREHMRAGLDELERHGLRGRYEFGAKHPRLIFTFGGTERQILTAFSPRVPGAAAKLLRQAVRRIVEGRQSGGLRR